MLRPNSLLVRACRWLLAALLLGAVGLPAARAVEPVRLQGCRSLRLDGSHLEALVDRGSRLRVHDVQHAGLRPVDGHRLNFGPVRGTHWLRFSVIGGGCDLQMFLDLGNQFVSRVLIYRETPEGDWVVDWVAPGTVGRNEEPRVRHAFVPIQSSVEQPVRYIVEFTGPGAAALSPAIVPGNRLSAQVGERMLLGGVFAGGIVALAAYFAVLAALTRIRGLFAYSISALGVAGFYALAAGLIDLPLMRTLPESADPYDGVLRAHAVLVLTAALFHWLFVHGMLSDAARLAARRRWIPPMIALWLALSAAVPFADGRSLNVVCMVTAVLAIVAIVPEVRRAVRRGHPLGRVMALAIGAQALTVLGFVAMYGGWLPWHPALLHGVAVGAWIETILLSVAVGSHVKQLRGQQQQLAARTEELSMLSRLDPLTGLGNRRAYDAVVDAEIERCLRRGRTASLLVVDIDQFKEINDRHGHAFGDSVIRTLAMTVANCVRSTDFAFRYGGDEFVVLLPGLDAAMALEVAERIMAEFRHCSPPTPDGARPGFSVSVGLAELDSGDGAQRLFERADAAMYRAKQNGRARAEVGGASVQSSSADANSAALNA